MLIPMEVVLGLACTFYVLVAIRWCREVMTIRREGKRASSAIVPLLASAAVNAAALDALGNGRASASEFGNRGVIVMGSEKTRKHDKRVVA
jgi:hypothetical protein